MIEKLKVRIEPEAAKLLAEKQSTINLVRVGKEPIVMYDLELPLSDARWEDIRQVLKKTSQPSSFFGKQIIRSLFGDGDDSLPGAGYTIIDFDRKYSKGELEAAEYFQLDPSVLDVSTRDPSDEATIYDLSHECNHCRAGWRQISNLRFDKRRLKGKPGIFRSFGRDEWIIHERLRRVVEPIVGDEVRFRQIDDLKTREPIDEWYQILGAKEFPILGEAVNFGYNYLFPRHSGKPCPLGHAQGFCLTTEIAVIRESVAGFDFAFSAEKLGGVGAISLPISLLLVSKRVMAALSPLSKENKFRFYVVRIKSSAVP